MIIQLLVAQWLDVMHCILADDDFVDVVFEAGTINMCCSSWPHFIGDILTFSF